jgi:hypothetical protein
VKSRTFFVAVAVDFDHLIKKGGISMSRKSSVIFLGVICCMSLLSPIAGAQQNKISDFVTFNGRITPEQESPSFNVPSGTVLVITDVVIQNRAPGDEPVHPSQFSRVDLGQFLTTDSAEPTDLFFTVVGNDTLNIHFTTGLRAPAHFRVLNVISGTAPFIEFTITGFKCRKPTCS